MEPAGAPDHWEAPARRRWRRGSLIALTAAVALSVTLVLARVAGSDADGLVVEPSPAARVLPPAPPAARAGGVWIDRADAPLPLTGVHVASWTGAELLAWGGHGQVAAYALPARRWRLLPVAPLGARFAPALVWTGDRLVVWGGERLDDGALTADGAALEPRSGRWQPLPEAPLALRRPVAAWSGRELLVWGPTAGGATVAGAALDPAAGRWRRLPAAPVRAADAVEGLWTGTELVIWGRDGRRQPFAAAYDPAADGWRLLPAPPLSHPARAAAAWTGREVVLWGRPLRGHPRPAAPPAGAALDPAIGRWRLLPPAPGYEHAGSRRGLQGLRAAWTGDRVVVIGGHPDSVTLAYDPGADRWEQLPDLPGITHPVVAWTGPFRSAAGVRRDGELLVWGGYGPYGPTVALRSWRTVGLGPSSDARWRTVP